MRHKYVTHAFVLGRTPIRESAALVTLLTSDLGLVRARAEGLRTSGAKLASGLQTLSRVEVTLVRGKEAWRITGSVLEEQWFTNLDRTARARAGRIAALITRLVHGETSDPTLFSIFAEFLTGIEHMPEEVQDSLECVAALGVLRSLGLDAGSVPEIRMEPASPALRREMILRINRGITASGL